MSSAKNRLQQVTQHVNTADPEAGADLICTTREHSPGHNVATLTFSNPSKLNVLTGEILRKLESICHELGQDEKLRAVVVTGAPPLAPGKARAFIGGADIQQLSQLSNPDDARVYARRVHQACAAIQHIPVPVIARVDGFSLGAGLEIQISCDLSIATKASKFGMPEAKIGLPSIVEAAIFPSLIGIGKTRRLIYLGENLSSQTALEWGLVERVVEDTAALDRAVEEWVGMIVSMGPKNMRVQKRLIRKWENSTLEEGIEAGVEALAETYADGGKEAKELMKPFLGKASR